MSSSGLRAQGACFFARSRAAFTARRIDSVPPDVMVPTVSGPPESMLALMRTTSASILRRLLKAIGFRPFSEK
jgi:hypothetical protein